MGELDIIVEVGTLEGGELFWLVAAAVGNAVGDGLGTAGDGVGTVVFDTVVFDSSFTTMEIKAFIGGLIVTEGCPPIIANRQITNAPP